MTKEEEIRWRKASRDAVLKALREAGEEQRQRRLKEQSEEESLKTASSDASPAKTRNSCASLLITEEDPQARLTNPDNPPMTESLIRIQPPSENVLRINRALSALPRKQRTTEEVRKQVQEHLRQAAEEISRHGRERQID